MAQPVRIRSEQQINNWSVRLFNTNLNALALSGLP